MTNKKKRPRVDMTSSKPSARAWLLSAWRSVLARRRCEGEEEKEEPTSTTTTTVRIYLYHPKRNAAPKFFSVVSSDPAADVPPKLRSFAHCIMEDASTGELLDRSPLVFDLDAKAKPGFPLMSTSNESGGGDNNAKRHRLAVRRVRFAVPVCEDGGGAGADVVVVDNDNNNHKQEGRPHGGVCHLRREQRAEKQQRRRSTVPSSRTTLWCGCS